MCSMADWTLPTQGAIMKGKMCEQQLANGTRFTDDLPVTVMLPVEKIFKVALGSLRR